MVVLLARQWGVDVGRCLLAGLLHDLGKPYAKSAQREKLDGCTAVPPTRDDFECAPVWHGLISAQEGRAVYGVEDREVLEAVAYHSTGAPNLGDVGLVLYVSDFAEPSRNWAGVEQIRAHLRSLTLKEAAAEVARLKQERLDKKGQPAHPRTHAMYEWLQSSLKKGG
ncbi:MAG: hypothetical protein PWP23_2513 [Candidatus Sumerlaeota bacterium]|nr:hypothetical protein [Candidatus Sumerlaeota bacterium]